jgi:hypothetical protein
MIWKRNAKEFLFETAPTAAAIAIPDQILFYFPLFTLSVARPRIIFLAPDAMRELCRAKGHPPARSGQFSVPSGEPDYRRRIVAEDAGHGWQISGPVANDAIDRSNGGLRFRHRIQIAHRAIMPASRGVGQITAIIFDRNPLRIDRSGRTPESCWRPA